MNLPYSYTVWENRIGRPPGVRAPDDNTRMTISHFFWKGMKSAWINKDLIRIDVLEQLKILIIHRAINKP